MYTIGGAGDEGVLAALARQEEHLASLLGRFEQSLQAYRPPTLGDAWHGSAQHHYARSVERLRADLDAVAENLGSALAHTRRALDTMTRPTG